MGASIRARIREKNRWMGKAMFTGNQESMARGLECIPL